MWVFFHISESLIMKLVVFSFISMVLLSSCVFLKSRTPENGVGPGKVYHSSQAYLEELGRLRVELANSMSCCTELNQIEYEEVSKIPSKKSLKLNNTAQIYKFKTGNSYVRGIKLPESKTNYKIRIISNHVTSDRTVTTGGFFYPSLMLLNENYEVIERHDGEEFSYYSKEGIGFQTDSGLRKDLLLSERRLQEAKYLLVYTTKEQMMKKTRYLFGGARVYKAPETDTEIMNILKNSIYWLVIAPNTPTGKVSLKFMK